MLFAFNIGVELGQLVFVGAVSGLLLLARWVRWSPPFERHALRVASYAIGTLAAFWFVKRVANFST